MALTTITQTTATIEILDFVQVATATASTTSAEVLLHTDGVAMSVDDFIVNTTRSNTSRRIDNIPIAGVYELLGTIPNQAQDDVIRQYRFTDHTDLLKDGTLNLDLKIEEETEASFVLQCTPSYLPRAGQYIKIYLNSTHVFTGFIKSVRRVLPQNAVDTKIFCSITCSPLKNIPPRRTITIAYEQGTPSNDIVESMINTYLIDEGVASGTIEQGVILNDDWYNDCLSIGEILDNLAEKSGFQWSIDKNFQLQYYQDPTTISSYSASISDLSGYTFDDFRNIAIEETIENYENKAFYVGNTDYYSNFIIVSQETTASILEIQDITAGTGVYGTVVRDSNMTEHYYYTATTNTSETVIEAIGIDSRVDVGDLVANLGQDGAIRFERRNVTAVASDSITLASAISGQTVGDVIVTYQEINDVVDNHLKRSDVLPRILEFESFKTDFAPAQKIQVALSKLSATTTETYVIESVNIRDRGANYFVSHVIASRRNSSNVSTQKTPTYKDYFKEF